MLNDAAYGHSTRHNSLLEQLVACMRSVWGGRVAAESTNYGPFSDHRPDTVTATASRDGNLRVGDLKLNDPLSSDPEHVQQRNAYVSPSATPHPRSWRR